MPELDLWFFAIAGPAAVFAGVSKAGFGSGAAFAGASILALVLDPGLALGVMLPLLMLIDLATLGPYWRQWRGRDAALMMAGGLPGVALGAWFYAAVNDDVLRVLIGAISVLFVLWQMAFAPRMTGSGKPAAAWVGATAGCAAGFTSFVSHAGGPPAAIYMLSQRMSKTEYQATTVLVFWGINITKAVPYTFLGLFTWETLWADLLLAPFALLGTALGVWLHRIIPAELFFLVTYVLLIITGSKLLWDGLT